MGKFGTMGPEWISLIIIVGLGHVAVGCNRDFQERFRLQAKDACTKGTDFSRGATRVLAQVGRRLASCLTLKIMGDHERRKRSAQETDNGTFPNNSTIGDGNLITENQSGVVAPSSSVLNSPTSMESCASGSECGRFSFKRTSLFRFKRSPEPRRGRPPPPPRTPTQPPKQHAPALTSTTSPKPSYTRTPTSTSTTPSNTTPAPTRSSAASTESTKPSTPPPSSAKAVTSNTTNRQNKSDENSSTMKSSDDNDRRTTAAENSVLGHTPGSTWTGDNKDAVTRISSSTTTPASLEKSFSSVPQNKSTKNPVSKSPATKYSTPSAMNETLPSKKPGHPAKPNLFGIKTPSFSANIQSWIYQYMAQIILSVVLGCSALLACLVKAGKAGCCAIFTCCCRKSKQKKITSYEMCEF